MYAFFKNYYYLNYQIILVKEKLKYVITKLLYGSVCAPRQLQGHVDSPPLVLHTPVGLQGNTGAGRFRDDGYVLVDNKMADMLL